VKYIKIVPAVKSAITTTAIIVVIAAQIAIPREMARK
jgi:hypothetical protein